MNIRSLIIDDERPARQLIATLLQREPGFELLGECSNGREALEAIPRLNPDLLFLDVRMPGLDGFEILHQTTPAPMVIFVTAFSEHAANAFSARALDYLLKPVEFARFREAAARARTAFASAAPALGHRLAIRESGKIIFFNPSEIDWAESEGNYIRLHIGPRNHLWRETLNEAETRLFNFGFLRANRSTLVNLDRVRQWQPLLHGDSVLILRDGTRIGLSRTFRSNFDRWISALP